MFLIVDLASGLQTEQTDISNLALYFYASSPLKSKNRSIAFPAVGEPQSSPDWSFSPQELHESTCRHPVQYHTPLLSIKDWSREKRLTETKQGALTKGNFKLFFWLDQVTEEHFMSIIKLPVNNKKVDIWYFHYLMDFIAYFRDNCLLGKKYHFINSIINISSMRKI